MERKDCGEKEKEEEDEEEEQRGGGGGGGEGHYADFIHIKNRPAMTDDRQI